MKEALVRWVEGLQFLGEAGSNRAIVVDGDATTAPSPKELVIIGLAACTGVDVVSILKKMRVGLDGLEVRVRAEEAEKAPKVFTKIEIEYRVRGKAVPEDKLQRALDLSKETYCSVGTMLKEVAEISYRYTVLPGRDPAGASETTGR